MNNMLEPDFWKATGRYSKRAIREAQIDDSPIEVTDQKETPQPE
ncbi:MAG: hypothetical protein ACYC55_00385 [Candidatus Geothermincolia bacterium]